MGIFSFVGDAIAGLTGGMTAHEKTKQKRQMNKQIQEYNQQMELTKKQLAETKAQNDAEKRRVQEKQIRALRRTNRAQGFLGITQEQEPGMSDKLGG